MSHFFSHLSMARAGNVAPIFALALLPIIAAAGAAVDFSNGFRQRELVQSALDAASVAGSRINGIETDPKVRAEALAIFQANLAGKVAEGLPLAVAIAPGKVVTSTTLTVRNYFLGITGLPTQTFHLSSTSVVGSGTMEVVMVLDTSGSMQGTKISTLKQAARDLVRVLFDGAANSPKPEPVKVGIVPFSRAVNVGPGYRTASWMDGGGVGTYHTEHFETAANRFTLFDQLGNASWQGCVEMRPYPYDVRDAAPTSADKKSLFVPYFAPDEPDSSGYYTSYSNDYIADTGGSCVCEKKKKGSGIDCTSLTDAERQALVCKYSGQSISGATGNGVTTGPNFGCTANPLQPMTTNRSLADSRITALQADGLTNITAGVMWGWRVLSPGLPFTEGRAYNAEDNTKVLIVMTDGANTYSDANNFNNSGYGAWSYAAKGHLGTTSSNNNTIVAKMDERTLEACANIHNENIRVYTVAFQVDSAITRQILRDCASNPEMAYNANSNSELLAAFKQIGTDLSELRLER